MLRRALFFSVLTVTICLGLSRGQAETALNLDQKISRLINKGQFASAQELLKQSNPSPVDAQFFKARLLKAHGRFGEAIALLRKILVAEPGYINAKRELSHTLLMSGDHDNAEHHFLDLMKIDRNIKMRDGYRKFLAAIRMKKPVGVSANFAFLPSTNINRGTDNETIHSRLLGSGKINEASKTKSGTGVEVGLSGFFRDNISDNANMRLNWRLVGKFYEQAAFNSYNGRLGLAHQSLTRNSALTIEPFVRLDLNPEKDDAGKTELNQDKAAGLRMAAFQRLDPNWSLSGEGSFERRFYDVHENSNGSYAAINTGARYQFDPGMWINFGINASRLKTQQAHSSFDGGGAFAGLTKKWRGGLTTQLSGKIGRRAYGGLFPLKDYSRRDDYYEIGLGISDARLGHLGYTPQLSCTHRHNRSNVELYHYSVNECRLGLIKAF